MPFDQYYFEASIEESCPNISFHAFSYKQTQSEALRVSKLNIEIIG